MGERRPRSCACRGRLGRKRPGADEGSSRPRHALLGSPSRLGGARDRQVTSRRCGRERLALERRRGGVVREVAAARCSGMRHLVLRRRREARRREGEVGGRDGGQPERRAQRRYAAVGRAIGGPQPLGCRRAKLLVAETAPTVSSQPLRAGMLGGGRSPAWLQRRPRATDRRPALEGQSVRPSSPSHGLRRARGRKSGARTQPKGCGCQGVPGEPHPGFRPA